MKQIIINIPDGADEKMLTVHSGQQQVAWKLPDSNWYVLSNPCVKCGLCCKDRECEHLNEDNQCQLAYTSDRPWRCMCDNPRGIPDYCPIEYEEKVE